MLIPKLKTLSRICDAGIVAVVRCLNEETAEKIARACIAGGIPAIEITFTVPRAEKLITRLRKMIPQKELIIGAGTVLDSETARISILAGAEYVVSPIFNLATAKLCNRYQIPYMPGCITPTEMIQALEAGADVIKVFPGNSFGPNYIKALKGPLPQLALMATGGVNLDNVAQWIKSGCIAVGVGSELTSVAKNDDYNLITQRASQFINRIKEARK